MANSLFDQLKKSGLVDKNRAQKSKRDQYKNKKQKSKKSSVFERDTTTLLAEQAHTEKVERDRLLNQQKKEVTERNAITAQIKQLIESNAIKDCDGDIAYNFTDANVIRRIYISEKTHRHITSGLIAIAKLARGYELVPAVVAEKLKQRDKHCIINSSHITETELDEDDPYADYKVPDDLMW